MNTTKIILLAAVVWAFAACGDDGVSNGCDTFRVNAQFAPQSRTSTDESGAFLWTLTDNLGIVLARNDGTDYSPNSFQKFMVDAIDNVHQDKATFKPDAKSSINTDWADFVGIPVDVYAISPHIDGTVDPSAVTFILPATQEHSSNLTDPMYAIVKGKTISAATKELPAMMFQHLTSLFCFRVKNIKENDITLKNITLTTDNGATPFATKALTANLTANTTPTLTSTSATVMTSTLTLNVAQTVSKENARLFYLTLCPVDLTNIPLTFTVTTADGKNYTSLTHLIVPDNPDKNLHLQPGFRYTFNLSISELLTVDFTEASLGWEDEETLNP